MAKIGRNDLCSCGSGKKYKKCCELSDRAGGARSRFMLMAVGGAVLAAVAAGILSFTTEGPTGATRVPSLISSFLGSGVPEYPAGVDLLVNFKLQTPLWNPSPPRISSITEP